MISAITWEILEGRWAFRTGLGEVSMIPFDFQTNRVTHWQNGQGWGKGWKGTGFKQMLVNAGE